MTPRRKQRLILVSLMVAGVTVAITLALMALNENINLFFTPTQVANGEAPEDVRFRLGGMVVENSVQRSGSDLTVQFALTDTARNVPVQYSGILPDLFREGQGIVAQGVMKDGVFVADEVLAKHDENYMPPEVQEALDMAQPMEANASQ